MSNIHQTHFCGIDLGTTNSCLAVLIDGEPRIVEIDGQSTMPSVVAVKDGEWLVGTSARNHRMVEPQQGVASIKRKMDDLGYRVTLADRAYSPIDISSTILRSLIEKAERQINGKLRQAVITVPAWFKEQQRQATLEAGKAAGLEVLQIINEPTAAAIAHEREDLREDQQENWLVYDLGGGTFDVSLVQVSIANYQVLASSGNSFLGGDDFDLRLANRLQAELRDQHNVDILDDTVAKARLLMLAERIKIALSEALEYQLEEPIAVQGRSYLLRFHITRDQFENLIEDLIQSTEDRVEQVLAEAHLEAGELDKLLLVGGSTRIPMIAERLQQRFGLCAENWLDPDLSVALGACMRAAMHCGHPFQRSVVDICPHSLGVAALGQEDLQEPTFEQTGEVNDTHPLTFAPIIRRNSRLPAKFVRTFFKMHSGQRGACVAVYQGEHSNTRHNNFIGQFFVEFNSDSDELNIGFAYDINGVINIQVKEGGGQERTYRMNTHLSAEGNSRGDFVQDDQLASGDVSAEGAEAELAGVSNYLLEKVLSKLATSSGPHDDIEQQLQRYRELLQAGDDSAELDQLEDALYEWVEGEAV